MLSHNLENIKPNDLIGVKRRLLLNYNSDGHNIKEYTLNDQYSKFVPLDSITCLEIINNIINKPNIPIIYKNVNQTGEEDQDSKPKDTSKREFTMITAKSHDSARFNFTTLAIMNRFLYKLTNTTCSCNLQAINNNQTNRFNAPLSPVQKILCPIHSGYPMHETMRTKPSADKISLFGRPQSTFNILHTHCPEGIFVIKEMGLACKYAFLSQKKLHVLYILSLLGPNNHLSMFKLSSPLLSVGHVYLRNLYVTHDTIDGSVYNGPALFIATKNEFRLAKIADSLGNTIKINNKTHILNMQIILRQKNRGIKVSRILSHKPTGRIFILDQLNGVYEFVYQHAKTSYKENFFKRPFMTFVDSFYSLFSHVNSFAGFSDNVVKYTVNPAQLDLNRSVIEKPKPFMNCSCLKEQLDVMVKEPSLYYPPLLWEALSFDEFSLSQEFVGNKICTCESPIPCSVIPANYSVESLNSWYSSNSIRSNSTIIDGFVDDSKNILAILFLNGDIIVYAIPLFTLEPAKSSVDGILLRGDQIQQKLYMMNYNRHVGGLSYFGKENKSFCTISPASKADEFAANQHNVLLVLSDEFGTRVYIGLEKPPSKDTSPQDKLFITNYDNLRFSNNYILAVKGFRLLPPYNSPEGHLSHHPEHRSASLSDHQQSFYKSFSVDSNTYVTVQAAFNTRFVHPGVHHLISGRNLVFNPTRFGVDSLPSVQPSTSSFTFNPLTAGPVIPDSGQASTNLPVNRQTVAQRPSNDNNLYKITISVSDLDTFAEVSNEYKSPSRPIWIANCNTSECVKRIRDLKRVEWYDQFYIYLSEGEKLVSVFVYGDSPGRLVIITTYHIYNIEKQSQYSLLDSAIHAPISTLKAYDPKASQNSSLWLDNQIKHREAEATTKDDMDILDKAATAHLSSDHSDYQNITELECIAILFYLYAWMYSPQTFFKNVWNLLLNISPTDTRHDFLLSLLLPEVNSETRYHLLGKSLGIVSKNFNLTKLSKNDKIHPWPNMLLYGNVIYARFSKLHTKLLSPSVEGLLLLVASFFENLWVRPVFPSVITQLSRLLYIGTSESLDTKDKLVKYLKEYIMYYDYKHLYDQLDLLRSYLVKLNKNMDESYKDEVSEHMARLVSNDPASNWKHLIATEILAYRCRAPSTFNEIFGTDVMSSSKEDSNMEYKALKAEFEKRYIKDIMIIRECMELLEKAKIYITNLQILQSSVDETHKVYKLVDMYEKLQMTANVNYLSVTLKEYCSDNLYEKGFDEFINKLKEIDN